MQTLPRRKKDGLEGGVHPKNSIRLNKGLRGGSSFRLAINVAHASQNPESGKLKQELRKSS